MVTGSVGMFMCRVLEAAKSFFAQGGAEVSKHECTKDLVHIPLRLPEPDQYGNYWLVAGEGRVEGPCILKAGKGLVGKDGEEKSSWFASLGEGGVLWDNKYRLRYFESPEDALRSLRVKCR